MRRLSGTIFRATTVSVFLAGLLPALLSNHLFGEQAKKSLLGNDRGVYHLYAGGKLVGRENFEIRSEGDQIRARAETDLEVVQGGQPTHIKTSSHLTLSRSFDLESYDWEQKGAQSSSLTLKYNDGKAEARYKTVTGSEDWRDFELPPSVVILDDNAFHHYALLVERYDQASKGKQTFTAFVPQEAYPTTVSLEDAGLETVKVGGRSLPLRHFRVQIEDRELHLWVDERGRLQKLSSPTQAVEAIRQP